MYQGKFKEKTFLVYSFPPSSVSHMWGETQRNMRKKIQNCQVKTSFITFRNHNKHSTNILLNACNIPGTVLSNEDRKMKEDNLVGRQTIKPTTPVEAQPWSTRRRQEDFIQRRIYFHTMKDLFLYLRKYACTLTKKQTKNLPNCWHYFIWNCHREKNETKL